MTERRRWPHAERWFFNRKAQAAAG